MRLERLYQLTAMSAGLALACGDSTGPSKASFEWRGQIAPGQRLEIKGVNGSVRAIGSTASEVVVSATKRGQRSDPSSVRIEVIQHTQGITVCAVYPDVPGELPNECLPGDQGRMGVQDNDVNVTFDLSIPAGVDFVGRTVNGDLSADGLEGDATLMTVNGNVRADRAVGFASLITVNGDVWVSTAGMAEALTVNGSIDAAIGMPDWDRDLRFTTVNGGVGVTIPAATNAEVQLRTVHGSVACDFPLTEVSPRNLQGTIGSGGPLLTVTSVNGNVALRRGP